MRKKPRSPAVISLAVLADDVADWRPSQYGFGRWGFSMNTVLPVFKLLDYVPRMEALQTDPSPFDTVVLAHLKTLQTRRDTARSPRRTRVLRAASEIHTVPDNRHPSILAAPHEWFIKQSSAEDSGVFAAEGVR